MGINNLHKEAQEHDANAIGVYKKNRDDWPVGLATIELSTLLSHFLGSDAIIFTKDQVNGKIYREIALVVSVTF